MNNRRSFIGMLGTVFMGAELMPILLTVDKENDPVISKESLIENGWTIPKAVGEFNPESFFFIKDNITVHFQTKPVGKEKIFQLNMINELNFSDIRYTEYNSIKISKLEELSKILLK